MRRPIGARHADARRLIALGLAVGVLLGCETADVRLDRLTRFVDEIAFGSPLDSEVEADPRLRRWSGDMQIAVSGPGSGDRQPQVMAAVERMARLIGVAATPVAESAAPNITVVFVESPDFLVKRERVPCYVATRRAPANVHLIVQAEISISLAEPELVDTCLYHEFMHVSGFPYHSGVLRSILSPAHEASQPTAWDELALGTLYDPRLRPGMTRQEALPIVRMVLSELVQEP